MLDARFVRENPDVVRAKMKARHFDWDIDTFLDLDAQNRSLIAQVEQLQANRNASS